MLRLSGLVRRFIADGLCASPPHLSGRPAPAMRSSMTRWAVTPFPRSLLLRVNGRHLLKARHCSSNCALPEARDLRDDAPASRFTDDFETAQAVVTGTTEEGQAVRTWRCARPCSGHLAHGAARASDTARDQLVPPCNQGRNRSMSRMQWDTVPLVCMRSGPPACTCRLILSASPRLETCGWWTPSPEATAASCCS